MLGVLQGFGVVIIVIAAGYFLIRLGVLKPSEQRTLATIVYAVATPALLIDRLIHTDPRDILGPNFVVIAASAVMAVFRRLRFFGCGIGISRAPSSACSPQAMPTAATSAFR